jgi:hypothetical protein
MFAAEVDRSRNSEMLQFARVYLADHEPAPRYQHIVEWLIGFLARLEIRIHPFLEQRSVLSPRGKRRLKRLSDVIGVMVVYILNGEGMSLEKARDVVGVEFGSKRNTIRMWWERFVREEFGEEEFATLKRHAKEVGCSWSNPEKKVSPENPLAPLAKMTLSQICSFHHKVRAKDLGDVDIAALRELMPEEDRAGIGRARWICGSAARDWRVPLTRDRRKIDRWCISEVLRIAGEHSSQR